MSCRNCGAADRPEISYCFVCGELNRVAPCAAHLQTVARHCCVVCGTAVCDTCRRGTRHSALCEDHAGTILFSGWAQVLRTASELEAELFAGILRSAGLEAHVLSQKDRINVVTFGGLSVVRVLVPAFQQGEAAVLLQAEGLQASN